MQLQTHPRARVDQCRKPGNSGGPGQTVWVCGGNGGAGGVTGLGGELG